MAEHYGEVGILPARPLKPKDKVKVEAGVRVVQLWLLGRLRRQTFFSLEDCNREDRHRPGAAQRQAAAPAGGEPA